MGFLSRLTGRDNDEAPPPKPAARAEGARAAAVPSPPSPVFLFTDEGRFEVAELIRGQHDQDLEAPPATKNEAVKELIRSTLRHQGSFAPWSDLLQAVVQDPSIRWPSKILAILALAKVRTTEADAYLSSLVDDQNLHTDVLPYLAQALCAIGDASGLERLGAHPKVEISSSGRWYRAALSWQARGEWCPYLGDHGLCVQGIAASGCGMLRYPYDREKQQLTSSTFDLPKDQDYRHCPRHQQPRVLY